MHDTVLIGATVSVVLKVQTHVTLVERLALPQAVDGMTFIAALTEAAKTLKRAER